MSVSQGKIQAVVFDLDNTLLRSRMGTVAGLRAAASQISLELRRHGLLFSKLQILRKINVIERERRAPKSGLVPRKLYDRDNWWKLLLKNIHGQKAQGTWIHQVTLLFWDTCQKNSPPFSDAEATAAKLKELGYRLAIVSDSDGTPGMKKRRVDAVPFRRLFEVAIVAGEDTPKVKPSKAPFRLVAKKLGLPPEACVYVGDNPRTDIAGAKAVGMTTVLVRRKPFIFPISDSAEWPKPSFEVKALKEIPTLIGAREQG